MASLSEYSDAQSLCSPRLSFSSSAPSALGFYCVFLVGPSVLGWGKSMKWKALVKCTLELEVEIEAPDSCDRDHVMFMIEDDGCPGTGPIGAAIEAKIKEHREAGTCWACAMQGVNEVMKLERLG